MRRSLVVVGAGGKTGRAVADAAEDAGWTVRRLQRVDGDLRDPATLLDACDGADVLYHLAPNMSPDEELIGAHAIAAARTHRLRLVYHSVLAPGIQAMPHHWRKLRVEEQLWAAPDVPWTVLRPAPYLQNLVPYVDEARRTGRFRLPFDPAARLAMVDLADVGAAAVAVLADDDTVHGSFDLCGDTGVTHRRVAGLLGAEVVRIAPDEWPVPTPDLTAMFRWYDRCGLPGSTVQLRALLGREPTTLEAWLSGL